MKVIALTQGKVAFVDDEDFERLNAFKWHAWKHRNTFYAVRMVPGVSNRQRRILMHHEIVSLPSGAMTDHKNGNGLDNQKENLRPASNGQNMANRRKNKVGSSRFKGVWWNKSRRKWQAQVQIGKIKKHLGLFIVEIEAARAYDAAAKKYFGEFARPNFRQL